MKNQYTTKMHTISDYMKSLKRPENSSGMWPKNPGNHQLTTRTCVTESPRNYLGRKMFTGEWLSTFLKVTLVPNPRYFKRMWFLRNAEQTLLTKKQYRSLAISGFSSQFLTLAWNNCFCLAPITLSLEQTYSLFYTRLKKQTRKWLEKRLKVTIRLKEDSSTCCYEQHFSAPTLESVS